MDRQSLEGVRVVDLGHEWACPHAARLLADFGAEVYLIEYVKRLDIMRGGKVENQAYNTHPRYWQLHRNKKMITLDLKDPQAKEIFADLVRGADLVMENSRPGVLDRLGFSYDTLKQLNPAIILVSMSAFGRTGPDAALAGYGGTIEATSGIQSLTGYAPDEIPKRIREMDVTNGIMGACAAVTALVARQHSGQGDWIDLSESEAATHGLCGEQFLEFALHGSTTMPWGNRDLEHAPQGCYACQGEDEWMVLSIASDAEWQRFCAAVQHPEWATDPRFSTAADRRLHHDALDSLIEAWTQQHTPQEAMQILQQAGIAAGAVLDVGQLGEDPHLEHRRYFQTPLTGPSDRYPGFALQISGGGGVLKHRGADLGEHNHAVICDLLHYPESALKPILADEIGTSFDPE